MTVCQKTYRLDRWHKVLADGVDHDKIVAKAVHLAKANLHLADANGR
jgi:hypothetical protein